METVRQYANTIMGYWYPEQKPDQEEDEEWVLVPSDPLLEDVKDAAKEALEGILNLDVTWMLTPKEEDECAKELEELEKLEKEKALEEAVSKVRHGYMEVKNFIVSMQKENYS